MKLSSDLDKQLMKLQNTDAIMPKMLEAGVRVVSARLKAGAHDKFVRFITVEKPKKSKSGWFARIVFKGKTSSGADAGLAVGVYEYGRQGYHPQPARPHIRQIIEESSDEASRAMQGVLEGMK